MPQGAKGINKMKRILFVVGLFLVLGNKAFAITDTNETAGKAVVGSVSVSSSAATNMSSSTIITNSFAYNLCNEDATNKVRCGYNSSVSTVAANVNQGFWIKPGECEYRAVTYGIVIYCQAEGTAAIHITREQFGKP